PRAGRRRQCPEPVALPLIGARCAAVPESTPSLPPEPAAPSAMPPEPAAPRPPGARRAAAPCFPPHPRPTAASGARPSGDAPAGLSARRSLLTGLGSWRTDGAEDEGSSRMTPVCC
ncbi:unnamed protein product, partial [Urochloa humidicola]